MYEGVKQDETIDKSDTHSEDGSDFVEVTLNFRDLIDAESQRQISRWRCLFVLAVLCIVLVTLCAVFVNNQPLRKNGSNKVRFIVIKFHIFPKHALFGE